MAEVSFWRPRVNHAPSDGRVRASPYLSIALRYGEKLVKGSPNPRSYYKCSHPGCLAKKIVERSEQDGTVLSTEYKVSASRPVPTGALQLAL